MKKFKRIAEDAPIEEQTARMKAVRELKIGQVSSLMNLFGYAGVDGETLDCKRKRLDAAVLSMSEWLDEMEDHESLMSAFRLMCDCRFFVNQVENQILEAVHATVEEEEGGLA
jgi:hypothetical protein